MQCVSGDGRRLASSSGWVPVEGSTELLQRKYIQEEDNSSQLRAGSLARSTACYWRGSLFGKPAHRIASKNGIPKYVNVWSQEAREMGRKQCQDTQNNLDLDSAELPGATDSESDLSPELLNQTMSYIRSNSNILDPKITNKHVLNTIFLQRLSL